ncbi:MAG: amino acid adenylation domain-containing protein, partial [Acidobacteriota bacterium]
MTGRDREPSPGALRERLGARLPEYMVPSAFAVLEVLPLNANGKVDRSRLAELAIATVDQQATVAYVAPRTPTEQIVALIWEEVLERERIGVQEDFFALGGHSLLATRLVSRIRESLSVELPLRQLFEAPTVAELSVAVDSLLRAEQGRSRPPLEPVSRDRELPLSFAQQRLWFLDQLEPGSAAYNIPTAYDLRGRLQVDALEWVLNEIARRHEVLRTTFGEGRDGPIQVVRPWRPERLPIVDLSALPDAARIAEGRRLGAAEAKRPFDLSRDPMLRAGLVRRGPEDHTVWLTIHHIASDGWSMDLLSREVGALYRAFTGGLASPLPELPVQYADFAAWQRGWLQGEVLEAEVEYWRRQLGSSPPPLDLPTDRPRPAVRTPRGAAVGFGFSQELSLSLEDLARQSRSTLFMVLLAGFEALLARLSGQHDVSVGTPIAGRTQIEVEPLIGFFVNTLVLRGNLEGGPGFREAIRRTRSMVLEANTHQEVPFEKLVEELAPDRSLSHSPLFQVMFVLQNVPQASGELSELEIQPLESGSGTSKFDMTVVMVERDGLISGAIEYSTDLFDRTTQVRLTRHFEALLSSAAAAPEQPLVELALLSAAEIQQLVFEVREQAVIDTSSTLLDLFEDQVTHRPEAIAVVGAAAEGRGEVLSYGGLNRRAEILAARLLTMGVGPEVRVGLLAERTPELLVALLGILKAGGVYVPLDPAYPEERLRFMLGDSAAVALVTCGLASSDHRLELDLPTVSVEAIGHQSSRGVLPEARPENLAYVIYTSGSTGRPKGVGVTHRNVVRLMRSTEVNYRFDASDVWTLFHSYAFDFSVWEIWGALAYGGRLVVVPHWVSRTPTAFRELLQRENVTVLNQTPSAFGQLVALDAAESSPRQPALRWVIFGGESLDVEALRPWLAHHGWASPRLVNMYGITETTVHVTYRPLVQPDLATPWRSPIGGALSDLCSLVLDGYLKPMPLGVAGELAVGGSGLARGYLGRPGLTAERFVPDGLGGGAGSRLYRSGDLVRRLTTGELDYLGRIDAQVKIRGFRIELGEIESALSSHPAVSRAAVVVHDVTPEDRRLVAYVVPESSTEAPIAWPEVLRPHLQRLLPEYMVPSVAVELESLPLTTNGKLDRKALPTPEIDGTSAIREYRAPQTPTEEIVAGIWAEVLGVERVGLDDHFFELGGHSLLATQVVSRLRSAVEIEVPLRRLFEAPTVQALATAIEELRQAGSGLTRPPLQTADRDRPLPLSFAQQRLWFLDQLEPGSPAYNIPTAFELQGDLRPEMLQRALTEIVQRHEVLRTVFQSSEAGPVQRVEAPRVAPLPVVDLSRLPEEMRQLEGRRLGAAEATHPFDLARDPVLRAGLVRFEEGHFTLWLTLHHIASDGWSMEILAQELGALYASFVAGKPSKLPELPIQYGDYAAWQRGWLQGEVLEAEVDFWRRQLAGAPAVLELPTDRPRPPVQTLTGSTLAFPLGTEVAEGLRRICRRTGSTLFMALLAALDLLLSRLSGQMDISVGTPIAGRTQVDIEPLIGFFVNTLVLRSRVAEELTFEQAVERVRSTVLEANAHQEVPFEKLVEELAPDRSLSYPPLFQVLFVLQNVPPGEGTLPDLGIRPVEQTSGTSKFDLTVAAVESGDGISGAVEYNTDLFDRTTIARWTRHLVSLLESAMASPEQHLGELSLLGIVEQHQLVFERQQRLVTIPQSTLLDLFGAQVLRAADSIAVAGRATDGESVVLSYGELDRRTSALAAQLAALGVDCEVRVGLLAERTPDLLVGLLGILRAGGAYVPLDPAYPAERLRFMLEDSASIALVTCGRGPANRLADVDLPKVRVEELTGETRGSLAPAIQPEHLAYVIYTSGSTGRPKGVGVTHANVVRLMHATEADYGFGPSDVWTLFHSYAFDFSVWEIWGALAYGGRLVVVPHWVSREPDAMLDLLWREGVTVLNQTPSAFGQLVAAETSRPNSQALRWVIFGGESLDLETLRPWFDRHGWSSPRLVNMYGITETTVHVTYRPLVRSDLELPSRSPIGDPLSDLCGLVLDRTQRPVPLGVAGELAVGGEGLARGYLGRPGLTAERFIPDGLVGAPGSRLYRSGDLVRRLAAGELEYLARIDSQVKIRGFRIELGEIESALSGHPAISRSAVLVHEVSAADLRLVAYLVPEAEADSISDWSAELRPYLQRLLPSYMVPSSFMELAELPLTANGKLDRRALPKPELESTTASKAYRAPQTPAEGIVAGIWAEVLGVERVGLDDHFFELGGHSLLATQVASRLRSAFEVEVPLRKLFEAPTVAQLATVVEELESLERGVARPAITVAPRNLPLPLSFAQQRLWFLDQLEPGSAAYNVPLALRLEGQLAWSVCVRAVSEIVRRHEVLRTTFGELDGLPVQRIAPPHPVPLAMIDLSVLAPREREAEAERLMAAEAGMPFDLELGPVLRAGLVRLGPADHVVWLTIHHIATDGWSMGLLTRELATLYAAIADDMPSPLPELSVQYADYAAWQRDWLSGEVLGGEVAYWRQQLASSSPVLALPTDRPRSEVRSSRSDIQPFVLDEASSEALSALGRHTGSTLFMVLLAGFNSLLGRLSGETDVNVGSPIAGRNLLETEPLIGFFVNTLVLRGDLDGDPSFAELVRRVRQTVLEAHAHQEVPFEKLVEELEPERNLEHTPLFQVMFVLQNLPPQEGEVEGLSLRPLSSTEGTVAKFDVNLGLVEHPNGIRGSLSTRQGLFDRTTAARWCAALERLLRDASANPDRRLSELEAWSPAERQQVLVQWNDSAEDYGPGSWLDELSRSVALRPDAMAVSLEDTGLSYRELDR